VAGPKTGPNPPIWLVAMSPADVRFEQPVGRPEFTIARPAARQRTDHTALMVMGLSLACTALAIFDLFLLASGH
jgi:hypothetical protein